MKKYAFLLSAAGAVLVLVNPAALAEDCAEVVAATVAEIRAGASQWSPEVEAVARNAAGSACIKARSARYSSDVTSEVIATGEVAAPTSTPAAVEPAVPPEEKGLVIRPLTSSPGKKPYERARVQDDN